MTQQQQQKSGPAVALGVFGIAFTVWAWTLRAILGITIGGGRFLARRMNDPGMKGRRRYVLACWAVIAVVAVNIWTPGIAERVGLAVIDSAGILLLGTWAGIAVARRRRGHARREVHEQMVGPSPFAGTVRSAQVERALFDLLWHLGAQQVAPSTVVAAVQEMGRPESKMWVTSMAEHALAELSNRSAARMLDDLNGEGAAMTWLLTLTIGLQAAAGAQLMRAE